METTTARTQARARGPKAGNHGAAGPDVAPGIPSRRENLSGRRADFAGNSRSLALEPGADRGGGSGIAGESPELPASVLRHCRLRSRPFILKRNRSLGPTGGRLLGFTTQLGRIHPSPVVHLNRAVAMAMRDGPEAGLAHIDAVLAHGELANYYLAHSARADMYRRLGRTAEARSPYEKALALTQQEPERQFLQERIRQLK